MYDLLFDIGKQKNANEPIDTKQTILFLVFSTMMKETPYKEEFVKTLAGMMLKTV